MAPRNSGARYSLWSRRHFPAATGLYGFLRMAHGSSRLTAISACTAGIPGTMRISARSARFCAIPPPGQYRIVAIRLQSPGVMAGSMFGTWVPTNSTSRSRKPTPGSLVWPLATMRSCSQWPTKRSDGADDQATLSIWDTTTGTIARTFTNAFGPLAFSTNRSACIARSRRSRPGRPL